MKTNFVYPDKENNKVEASFGIIRAIYEDEKKKITKKLPRITQQHIYPNNFDKMKVKFATQVLSNTTASAIRAVCDDTNDDLFNQNDIVKFALPTAYLCEMFNNCFDCLNKIHRYYFFPRIILIKIRYPYHPNAHQIGKICFKIICLKLVFK